MGGAWLPPYTGYYTGYVVDRGCVDLYRNFYKDLSKLQYERMTVGERERDKSLKLYGGSMADSEFERLISSG